MPDRIHSRPRLIFLAFVAGLHLLLAWLLLSALHRRDAGPLRETLRLVPITLAAPQPVAPQKPMRASVRTAVPARAQPVPVPVEATEAPPATEAALAAAVPTSSASAPATSLGLDPYATARALRESARNPTLAYRARVRDGKAPATLDERLEAGVKQAGRRDCLNHNVNPGAQGDTTMKYSPIPVGGILAAPFIVADAVLGKCGL